MFLLQLNWIWMVLIGTLFISLTPGLLKMGLQKSNIRVSAAIFASAYLVMTFIIEKMNSELRFDLSFEPIDYLWILGLGALMCLALYFFLNTLNKATVIQTIIGMQLIYIVSLIFKAIYEKTTLTNEAIAHMVIVLVAVGLIVWSESTDKKWVLFMILAAIAISGISIYHVYLPAKLNDSRVDLFAQAIATALVWIIFLVKKEGKSLKRITVFNAFFLAVSGVILVLGNAMTKLANQNGDVTIVLSISKLALPVAAVLSMALLNEKMNAKKWIAVILILVANYWIIL
jgi:uncharacterized membrane protein